MTTLLRGGYGYPQAGGLLTRGLFACVIDRSGASPKQTFVLDLVQFAEAEQLSRARGGDVGGSCDAGVPEHSPERFAREVEIEEPGAGLIGRWIMPSSRERHHVHRLPQGLVAPFQAALHHAGRSACGNRRPTGVRRVGRDHDGAGQDADRGERPRSERRSAGLSNRERSAVARFGAANYAKAKRLAKEKSLHLMDALSEVGFGDPTMMRRLARRYMMGR